MRQYQVHWGQNLRCEYITSVHEVYLVIQQSAAEIGPDIVDIIVLDYLSDCRVNSNYLYPDSVLFFELESIGYYTEYFNEISSITDW